MTILPSPHYDERQLDAFRHFGSETLIPIALAFVRWVFEQAVRDGCSRLFFLARDGAFPCQLFQAAYPDSESHYLKVSRRTLALYALRDSGENRIDYIARESRGLTRAELYQNFLPYVAEEMIANERDPDRKDSRHGRRTLLRARQFWIARNAEIGRSRLCAYLREQRFLGALSCGIVDIGWHGTSHRILTELRQEEGNGHHLYGYYFATSYRFRAWPDFGATVRSFYCHGGRPWQRHLVYSQIVELLELGFSHGEDPYTHYSVRGSLIIPEQAVPTPLQESRKEIGEAIRERYSGSISILSQAYADGDSTYGHAFERLANLASNPSAEEVALLAAAPSDATGFTGKELHRLDGTVISDSESKPVTALDWCRSFWRAQWRTATVRRISDRNLIVRLGWIVSAMIDLLLQARMRLLRR